MSLDEVENSVYELNRKAESAAREIFREYYTRQDELTRRFSAKCSATQYGAVGGNQKRRLAYQLVCVNELLTKHFLTPQIAFARSEVRCANQHQLGEILDQMQQISPTALPRLDFARFYDLANALHYQRQLVYAEFSKALAAGQKELELLSLTKQASTRDFDVKKLISAVCAGSSSLLHPLLALQQQRVQGVLLRHSAYGVDGCAQGVLHEPATRKLTYMLEERLVQLNESAAKGKQKQRLVNLIASGAKSMGIDEFLTSFTDFCAAFDCLEQQRVFLYFAAPHWQQDTQLLVQACQYREKEMAARINDLMKEQAVEEVIVAAMDYLQFRRVFELFRAQNYTIQQFRKETLALEQQTRQCGEAIFQTIALVAAYLVGRMKVFQQCQSQPEWVFQMWRAQTEIAQQRECVEWLLDQCRSVSAERICAQQKQHDSELYEEVAFFRILAGSVQGRPVPRGYDYTAAKGSDSQELRAALQKYEYLLTNLKAEAYQLCQQFSAYCEGVSCRVRNLADEYRRRLQVFVEAYRSQVTAQYQHVFGGYIDEYNRAAAERNALRAEELEQVFRRLWTYFRGADAHDVAAGNANIPQQVDFQEEKQSLNDGLDQQQQEAFQRCKQLISDYKRYFDWTKRQLHNLSFQELVTAGAAAQIPQISMALCAGSETMEATKREVEQDAGQAYKVEPTSATESKGNRLGYSEVAVRQSRKPRSQAAAQATTRATARRPASVIADKRQPRDQAKSAKTKFHLTRMLRNGSLAADLELMADRVALFYQGKQPQQLLYANIRSVSASSGEVRIHLYSSQVAVFSGEQSGALCKALTLCLKY